MTLISLVILPHKEIPAPPNIKLVEVVLFFCWFVFFFSRKEQMVLLAKWDYMI